MADTDAPGTQRERHGAFDHLIPRGERRRLGDLIRGARVQAGIQQRDLAATLGVPPAVLSKIEAGDREVSALELRVICKALGITTGDVLVRLDD